MISGSYYRAHGRGYKKDVFAAERGKTGYKDEIILCESEKLTFDCRCKPVLAMFALRESYYKN
jgi:hypothetical protein